MQLFKPDEAVLPAAFGLIFATAAWIILLLSSYSKGFFDTHSIHSPMFFNARIALFGIPGPVARHISNIWQGLLPSRIWRISSSCLSTTL